MSQRPPSPWNKENIVAWMRSRPKWFWPVAIVVIWFVAAMIQWILFPIADPRRRREIQQQMEQPQQTTTTETKTG